MKYIYITRILKNYKKGKKLMEKKFWKGKKIQEKTKKTETLKPQKNPKKKRWNFIF